MSAAVLQRGHGGCERSDRSPRLDGVDPRDARRHPQHASLTPLCNADAVLDFARKRLHRRVRDRCRDGVTALPGINDAPSNPIFTLSDAQQLTTFAQQNGIGELSMWDLHRDVTGTLGSVAAPDGSGIAQTPFEFSQIFEQIES